MDTTTHARRLYTVLALVAGMMLLAVVPAAADTQRELDGWANARLAETRTESGTSEGSVRDGGPRFISATQTQTHPVSVDGWAVGQGMRSQSQPVPVDGWAVGQGMRSQTAPSSTTAVQSPSSTPISLSTIVLGLLIAAVLGAGTAAVVGHRRQVPSAH